ncbi:phosphatidylethanolamine N-methyltransferase [Aspergillus homomorphus CBS 101889]|uniref:Phosphatidylethanolamine N-methyltransferase n=1 Tax=Aspergillus homomorphus (strain CBS 101889) TaxID=1450537 RepID=A0A395I413_ASPHC|nr:phosphatidylethanolamine N-methyltransferase [Aspergillus homomorphus CBS 101889]RAL14942.1 phosphatidylethanolamine N-methyltransferase [Aspergillus homomorphus CBS 101889]
MDRGLSTGSNLGEHALRERTVAVSQPDPMAKSEALTATGEVEAKDDAQKDKKTFGRTPGGTVFTVPQTHDMVSQLLSPSEPKNLSDVLVLLILGAHIFLLRQLPQGAKVPVFAVVYLFWRAAYNIGIGWLLHNQSHHNTLVRWAEQTKIFVNPSTNQNPHPNLYKLIKRELETKVPVDYSFDEAPLEYNTWLVFRRLVDLILMCDFTSYCLFAIACSHHPVDEGVLMTIVRWASGIALVLFNLWVKLDAHRVVKDFAWYWGDFFFLIDQELTFDGVFEMAPHPMYSVGYAGYYGISLMAASYKVLFISILAHAAQFAFLVFVENPHIDKTYNPPPPRKRMTEQDFVSTSSQASEPSVASSPVDEQLPHATNYPTSNPPPSVHSLLGLHNLDLHRITDSSSLLVQFLVFALTVLTPSTPRYQFIFVANAAIWRLWFSVGTGYLLIRQSNCKAWTRHFVKYGETPHEAWNQWKGTYHLSMIMCYASFIAAVWKMYTFPADWGYGLVLLRHVLGVGLICLQTWTSVSIYESLGEFGWFYGDFFFQGSHKLTYNGIYRFLNNPERVLGLAGVWGAVLITSSGAIIFLALISHVLSMAFIQFVERPHMQKLYGQSLRQDAGLVKSLKRSLPPSLRQLHGSVDKIVDESFEFIEELIDTARPKLAAGVNTFVKDTTALFQTYPARVTISRIDEDLAGYDSRDYSLVVEGTLSSSVDAIDPYSGREGADARVPLDRRGDLRNLVFEYGAPIKVRWTAPLNHSKKDWIGLYRVTDNTSREVTRVSSQGRWIATNAGVYDNLTCEKGIVTTDVRVPGFQRSDGDTDDVFRGEVVFTGDKLFWTQGAFEFRYHHNGKHNVMAISRPFEIRAARFDEEDILESNPEDLQAAVELKLLPVIRNCLDQDPEIAPETVDEQFGSQVERNGKYAKRVVFAVHQMFGVEFAPEVVRADGTVRNLAWRICNAKRVLAPYSMTSNGTSTPSETPGKGEVVVA